MSSQRLVSIITPLYNSAAYITDTYSSLRALTHQHWEWIVVDDASTDETLALVTKLAQSDPRVLVLSHTQNCGRPAAGRNTGIAAATGDYLTFLDHDDAFEPTKLTHQIESLESTDSAFITGNCKLLNEKTSTIDGLAWGEITGDHHEIRQNFSKRLLTGNFIPPNTTLIHKEAVAVIGLFDTSLSGVDDYDYWYRISRQFPCTATSAVVATWRYQNHRSISANDTRMVRDEIRFYEKVAALSAVDCTLDWEASVAQSGLERAHRMYANRLLAVGNYTEAQKHYSLAKLPSLAVATRIAGPALQMAYSLRRNQLRTQTHTPLTLDFHHV